MNTKPPPIVYHFPRSDRVFSLWTLWRERGDNPVWVYTRPSHRGLGKKFTLLVAWAVVVAMVSITLADILWDLFGHDLIGLHYLFLLFATFILIPSLFHDLVGSHTSIQLDELYLTGLTRPEVVFGSIAPALTHCVILSGVCVGNFAVWVAANSTRFDSTVPTFVLSTLIGLMLFLFMVNYLFKVLRLFFVLRRMRFLTILATPLSLLFDLFPMIFALFLVEHFYYSYPIVLNNVDYAILLYFVFTLTFLLLSLWNLGIAKKWMVALYYKELDDTRVIPLFFGRMRYREEVD